MEEILVKISADGSVEYSVKGVKGKSCKALTKDIDAIVGGAVLETKTTSEYNEAPNVERETTKAGR